MGSEEIRPGDVIAAKYRVVRLLGRSRGILVEAVHVEADQRVALQLLRSSQSDPAAITRFRQEARALAKMESEHVARILDIGSEPDGSFYLVRQWLEGDDLGAWVEKQEKIALDRAVLLILQASEAVAETHAHGIVLRELVPSHLFVTQRIGGAPLLKLVDFGTAKLLRGNQVTGGPEVTSSALFGLSPYASPELVRRSKTIDFRTDIWSLGAILYQILSRRPPFTGEPADLMLKIMKESPEPLARLRGDVPVELDGILNWALAKDFDERFRDVHAFAHALGPFAPPEGQVLIERIGQIAKVAKQRRRAEREARMQSDRQESAVVVAPPRSEPERAEPAVRISEDELSDTIQDGTLEERVRMDSSPPARPAKSAVERGERTRSGSHDSARASAPEGERTRSGSQDAARAAAERTRSGNQAAVPVRRSDPPRSGPVFAGAAADLSRQAAFDNADTIADAPLIIPPAPPVPTFDPSVRVVVAGGAQALATTPPAGTPARTASWPPVHRNSSRPPPPDGPPMRPSVPPNPPPSLPPTAAAQPHLPLFVQPSLTTGRKIGIVAAVAVCVALPTLLAIFLLRRPPPAAIAQVPSATQTAAAATATSPAPSTEMSPPPDPVRSSTPRTGSPAPAAALPAGTGTLIAVALGGTCTFAVNGSVKGSGPTLKLVLKAGAYTVSCTPPTGGPKQRSVTIKPGDTAMATFKLQ